MFSSPSQRSFIGFATPFIIVFVAGFEVRGGDFRRPLELENASTEFPPALKAIDAGIMLWQNTIELVCHYRITAGMAASRDQAEQGNIMSRKQLTEIYGKVLREAEYPQVRSGLLAKNRKAFRYSLDGVTKLFGVSPFDCGESNGVTVVVRQFHSTPEGKMSGGSVHFSGGRNNGRAGNLPNPATPIDTPLFVYSDPGGIFESETKKGGGLKTQRFLWSIKKTGSKRLIVIEERWRRAGGDKGEQLLQHREVTIRVDGKYPLVEKIEYWFPDSAGRLSLGSSIYASRFVDTGNGCLFPTKVITVLPAIAAPAAGRKTSKQTLWQVRIWETNDAGKTRPNAETFRIPLSPGMIVRGYPWPRDRMTIDLLNLDPTDLKRDARVQLPGNRAVRKDRSTAGSAARARASGEENATPLRPDSSVLTRRNLLVITGIVGVIMMIFAASRKRVDFRHRGENGDRGKEVSGNA